MVDRVGTLSKTKKELGPGIHNRACCPHMETPSFLSSWLSVLLDCIVVLFQVQYSPGQRHHVWLLSLSHFN